MDKIVNYLMKFKFVVKFVVKFGVGRTKGDIEALADARRALKKLNLSGKTSKIASSENVASESAKLMTPTQLKAYDGSEGSPGLYIGLLGHVFDVSKGKDHYGPGGGYSFFSAKDGSRAVVTGEFTEEGLTDDLTELDSESYLSITPSRTTIKYRLSFKIQK